MNRKNTKAPSNQCVYSITVTGFMCNHVPLGSTDELPQKP